MLKRLALIALALLLLLGGSFLILKYDLILDYWDQHYGPSDTREVIGKVTSSRGNPKFKLPKKLVYKNLHDSQDLRYYDTIQTDEVSSVTIAFNNGLVLELEENSLLVLERPTDGTTDGIVISFLQGNYKILQQGQAGKVFLTKDKEVLDTAGRLPPEQAIIISPDLEELELEATPTPPPVTSQRPKPTPKPTPIRPKESLPDDYIASIVKKQKPFFNRCYAQHLRLNPNASGKMNVSFTILADGNVNAVKVLRSSIADPRLQKCTLTVLERMQFRSFDGDPIVVNYPINFE